ncbi:SOS response-associated peptidase, partial [Acinetobacter baumannii]
DFFLDMPADEFTAQPRSELKNFRPNTL